MKVKVTEQGVTIPKSLLPDVDEVDIRKRNGIIEVVPLDENGHVLLRELGRKSAHNRKGGIPEDDPIMQMGRNPVRAGVTDGSVNLDKYIYGV